MIDLNAKKDLINDIKLSSDNFKHRLNVTINEQLKLHDKTKDESPKFYNPDKVNSYLELLNRQKTLIIDLNIYRVDDELLKFKVDYLEDLTSKTEPEDLKTIYLYVGLTPH